VLIGAQRATRNTVLPPTDALGAGRVSATGEN
jgi:hypothetical protein